MEPICLFEGCQEFANMFVVGLLDDMMVNPPSVFVKACAGLVSITTFYAETSEDISSRLC